MSLKIHDARGPGFYTYRQAPSGRHRPSEDCKNLTHFYPSKVVATIRASTLAKLRLRSSMVTRAGGTYYTYMCESWRLKCAGNITGAKPQVPSNMSALGLCHGLGMFTSRGIQLDIWGTNQAGSETMGRIACLVSPTLIDTLNTTSKFRVQHCYLPI